MFCIVFVLIKYIVYFIMYNNIIGLGSSHCLYKPSQTGTRSWYDLHNKVMMKTNYICFALFGNVTQHLSEKNSLYVNYIFYVPKKECGARPFLKFRIG